MPSTALAHRPLTIMKAVSIVLSAAGLLLSGASASECPDWFEGLGEEWLAKAPDAPGLQMTIWSPRCNLHCRGAWANSFDNYTAYPPVDVNTPYRLGSVTKPFTSATVLRLVEDGLIDVNEPVEKYLPNWAVATLEQQQGDFAEQITPWHLLHHTSGLPNHVEDPSFIDFLLANPGIKLSHREVLEWVAREIPSSGAAPGEKYAYTDLGYAYLGAVVEHTTNRTLGKAARDAAGWDRLCMRSTYWEVFEEHPAGLPPLARQFFAELDTSDLPPTPYGGSGVVSDSEDLARYARAFHTGQVLGELGMNLTYTTVPTFEGIQEYGCGWTWNVVAGREVWFHRGAWAAWMYYIPSLDLALGGAFNQIAHRPTVPLLVEEIVNRVAAWGSECYA